MKIKTPPLKYKSVMLIDDNEIDNFINDKMMNASNFAENIYTHTSAKSALEFLKNLEVIKNVPVELIPAYVFLDINMPILDGFQFLDAFDKFSTEFKSAIKIVMLTTSLNPSDIEKTKRYKQVVKFLHKPLTEAEIRNL